MQAKDITKKNVKTVCKGTGIEVADDLAHFKHDGREYELEFPVHPRSALARILMDLGKVKPARSRAGHGARGKGRVRITLSDLQSAEFWASQDEELVSKVQEALGASEELRRKARVAELEKTLAGLESDTERTKRELDKLRTPMST